MDESAEYVRKDDHGGLRIADSDVSPESVVGAWLHGDSPDEIQRNFPSLTLEQAYGAIAYYLGHRAEVDQYLERQGDLWDCLRSAANDQTDLLLDRLRALKHQRAGTKG